MLAFLALLQEHYKKRLWLGFLLELAQSFQAPDFLHTYTTRSSGKHRPMALEARAREPTCSFFSPDIMVCPDRSTSVASSAPGQKEDAGKLHARRAGRHHTWAEGTAAGRDSSPLQTGRTKRLCSLTRSTAPSHCAPWLLIWATTGLKSLHKWALLFGLLPF